MQAAGSEDYADMDYIYTLYLFNTASRSLPISLCDIMYVQALVFLCVCTCTHMTDIWHSTMTSSFKLGLEELLYIV